MTLKLLRNVIAVFGRILLKKEGMDSQKQREAKP